MGIRRGGEVAWRLSCVGVPDCWWEGRSGLVLRIILLNFIANIPGDIKLFLLADCPCLLPKVYGQRVDLGIMIR